MRKDSLLSKLKEYNATECFLLFRRLLEAEILECRESNDAAKAEDVLKNQGAIACLKKLLKNTAPKSDEEHPVYDGGFN